jgi:hypothetical protein
MLFYRAALPLSSRTLTFAAGARKAGTPGSEGAGARRRARLPDIWGVLDELKAAGPVVLADKGYQGDAYAKIPYRGRTSRNPRNKPTQRTRNCGHPVSVRTPSSRPGASSAGSAAAPGAPDISPTPWYQYHDAAG